MCLAAKHVVVLFLTRKILAINRIRSLIRNSTVVPEEGSTVMRDVILSEIRSIWKE